MPSRSDYDRTMVREAIWNDTQNIREAFLQFMDNKTINAGRELPLCTDKMVIAIPTYMRESQQKVFNRMPAELQKLTRVYTRESRVDELKKFIPAENVFSLPDDTAGIAQTRQRVLEDVPSKKLWMIDDKLIFRRKNREFHILAGDPEDFFKMYAGLSIMLDYVPIGGISPGPMNDKYNEMLRLNMRLFSNYAIRTDILKQEGIKFTGMYEKNPDVRLYEDFYVVLSLLTRGYSNMLIYDYCFDHVHNSKGGNSTYRTSAMQKMCAEALSSEFPGIIKLVTKNQKTWGGGMDVRTDVQVSWKKAVESYSKKVSSEELF